MLVDPCGRKIDYLRLSVTDRCNLSCTYCSPPHIRWQRRGEILSYEEMLLLIDIAVALGIRRIRLTGGEPLQRKGFVHFIERIDGVEKGIDVSLTTNGVLLAGFAKDLFHAGLRRVNISLDTLEREKYRAITGSDYLSEVLHSIDVALQVGLKPVKLNVVLIKGLNDNEVESFVELTRSRPLNVRFIEFMPSGTVDWNPDKLVPVGALLKDLEKKYGAAKREETEGGGPSMDFRFPGFSGLVGFISSLTEAPCSECSRLRVTAEGKLRPCLFSGLEFDLKTAIRGRNPREDVKAIILEAVAAKPKGHSLPFPHGRTQTPMAQIGG
jgi:cyclic pyranopterin phosphate synthase